MGAVQPGLIANLLLRLIVANAASMYSTPDAGAATIGLPDLTNARQIRIYHRWDGLNPIAPMVRVFTLTRAGDQISGSAKFSVNCYSRTDSRELQQAAELRPSQRRFASFLVEIARTELRPGPYIPRITHTDDVPSITIEIEGDGTEATFFTRSQGERHVPWGVRFDGNEYVLTNDSPMQAYEHLTPYLRLDIFYSLMVRGEKRDCRPIPPVAR
jgi:hypothetical protein